MAITHTVRHAKVSLKPDGADAAKVQPTDWNANHTVVLNAGANVVLGTESAGPVKELNLGPGLTLVGGTLDAPTALPVGMIVDFGGSSAPAQWLLCDGALHSTAAFADLFAVIGYTYGGAGGSFATPDLRGRAAFGRDSMGGSAANRVTSGGSGINGTVLGAAGGFEFITLDVNDMPAHTHTVSGGGEHTHNMFVDASTGAGPVLLPGEVVPKTGFDYTMDGVSTGTPTLGVTSPSSGGAMTLANAGGSGAHVNMPPAMMLTKIIFAGV